MLVMPVLVTLIVTQYLIIRYLLCTVILTLLTTTTCMIITAWLSLIHVCLQIQSVIVRSKLIILVWFQWDCFYYTLHALSAFSLVKSLQLILKINATYRLVSYLLEANWLTGRSCAQCMIHDFQEWCQTVSMQQYVCHYFLQNKFINMKQ